MPNLQEVLEVLKDASEKQFWGQIQFDFQNGKPTLVRISETRKFQTNKENNQYGHHPQ